MAAVDLPAYLQEGVVVLLVAVVGVVGPVEAEAALHTELPVEERLRAALEWAPVQLLKVPPELEVVVRAGFDGLERQERACRWLPRPNANSTREVRSKELLRLSRRQEKVVLRTSRLHVGLRPTSWGSCRSRMMRICQLVVVRRKLACL